VEVQTVVHNTARDHRLRVLFPSGAATCTYLADSVFDVVERPIALRTDNHDYRELEVETKPQQSWTAVYDASRGLAVVSAGLLESAVRELPERPLALTLFRSTRRTVMTDGEPDGQLLGDLTFHYWLVPLRGAPDRVRLCELGQLLAAGRRDAQLRPADVRHYHSCTSATLPASGEFLRLEGSAVLSSVRQEGAGLEVRLFNPLTTPAYVLLHLGEAAAARYHRAERVNLESLPVQPARQVVGAVIDLWLHPKEIATVRLS
jgi:alpha-mannosidase/mannosylglycerate hydrolase